MRQRNGRSILTDKKDANIPVPVPQHKTKELKISLDQQIILSLAASSQNPPSFIFSHHQKCPRRIPSVITKSGLLSCANKRMCMQ